LGRIGPAAAEAIPVLRQRLTNSIALTKSREWIYNPQDRHLEMRDPNEAVASAAALVQIAPNDPTATAALQTLQTNPPDAVQTAASVALWQMGLATNWPLNKFTNAPEDIWDPRLNRHVSRLGHIFSEEAVNMLGDIGPPARDALPALEKHLDPLDPWRRSAAVAIQKIDPEAARRLGLPGLLIVCPR
jgi:HEAT repeat protein